MHNDAPAAGSNGHGPSWLRGALAAGASVAMGGGGGGGGVGDGSGGGGEEGRGAPCGKGVNAALNIAASIVGSYQPVGSFRFVYSMGGDASSPGSGNFIRLAESTEETMRLLQLETSLVWFTHLLLRDHRYCWC